MIAPKIISPIILLILISVHNVFGQSNNGSPFKIDFGPEAVIIGTGAVTGSIALVMFLNADPLTSNQIADLDIKDVNSFDRAAIGPYGEDYMGDVLQYTTYLLPLTFLANEDTRKDFGDLALMYGEVLLINTSINTIVKVVCSRVRPYVYDEQTSLEQKMIKDAKLSFYSGHTSNTASICFFTASVFNEYLTNITTKTLIWSAAALIPAITGFSRFNTHWHFPTDVIVGYIVGAAIGYLIPLIHKRDSDNNIQANPTNNLYKPLIGFQIKL